MAWCYKKSSFNAVDNIWGGILSHFMHNIFRLNCVSQSYNLSWLFILLFQIQLVLYKKALLRNRKEDG